MGTVMTLFARIVAIIVSRRLVSRDGHLLIGGDRSRISSLLIVLYLGRRTRLRKLGRVHLVVARFCTYHSRRILYYQMRVWQRATRRRESWNESAPMFTPSVRNKSWMMS